MSSVQKANIDKTFGKVLRDFRKKHQLTQEELSEKLGISLGITPNTIFIDLLTNPEALKNAKISEKIVNLSDEKKDFLNSIIDLLLDLDVKNEE